MHPSFDSVAVLQKVVKNPFHVWGSVMKQEDKRKRKFNEAIVNILYPQSSAPPREQQQLQPAQAFIEAFVPDNVGTLDHYENGSTSGEDEEEHECETEKLTRAQRKNIRKKKLKEEASRRGKLIGPLLPLPPATTSDRVAAEDAPPVRSNASEERGKEPNGASSSKKLKRRRMAKKLAKEKRSASTSEKCCNQSSITSSAVDQKEAHM